MRPAHRASGRVGNKLPMTSVIMRTDPVIRICFIISLIIIICGLLTGIIGHEYELRKSFSPEERMAADTDIVGFEWIMRGVLISFVGGIGLLFTGILAVISHVIEDRKIRKEQQE